MKLFNFFRKKNIKKSDDPVIDFYNKIDEDSRLLKKSGLVI